MIWNYGEDSSSPKRLYSRSFFFGDESDDDSSSFSETSSISFSDGINAKTVSTVMTAFQRRSESELQRSRSSTSLPSYKAKPPSSSEPPTKTKIKRYHSSASLDGDHKKHRKKHRSKSHHQRQPPPSPSSAYSKQSNLKKDTSNKPNNSELSSPTEKMMPEIVETEEPRPSFSRGLSVERRKSVMSLKTGGKTMKAGWQKLLDCCCGSLLLCRKEAEREMAYLKNETDVDYHKIRLTTLCERLQTDMTYGLTDAAVRVHLATFGPNKIRPPPSLPEWLKFCRNLVDGFCILLWIGSFLCFLAYGMQIFRGEDKPNYENLYLGCILAGVVLITGTFSYYQQVKSAKIMESLEIFMSSYTTVIRSGRERQVKSEHLVLGDIVLLKAGDKIPADCRVIKSINFKVDNSRVTGESEPQLRTPDYSNDNPMESKNVIFCSTFAVEGTAAAIVVATGDHTVIGRMGRLTTGLKQRQTPLSRELVLFVYVICALSAVLGLAFLTWYLVENPQRWLDAVVLFIGIVMGVIPGGVLIEVALCLTLAAKRMAERNCLVKNLETVETLGSTSTICSDKTGTLTINKMTVSHLWFSNETHMADVSKEQIVGRKYKADGEKTGWTSLIRVAALCNRAVFQPNQLDVDVMERECIGDGTESGLLRFVARSIGSVDDFRDRWPKLAEVPFTSSTKFQASVHRRWSDGRFLVVVKGAPEKVFSMCSSLYLQGVDVPIGYSEKASPLEVFNKLAEMGERVLGFAELLLPMETYPPNFLFKADIAPNFPLSGLRFIGLLSMMDPPRPTVPEAVRRCRDAGIRVVMITGDHPLTAKSIARKVGIIGLESKTVQYLANERSIPVSQVWRSEAQAIIVSGTELRGMTTKELDDIISHYKEIVFARTSPQQKLFIVEGFQRAGDIVAVTGDGINDSPALKQANIGIAMGISGSDVSKQGAHMILMDDNFATIVFAIEDGRKMFDNLKKTVCYILGGNLTEIAAVLSAVALSIPLPMSTNAMLVLSLLTDMFPAVMLAYDDPEPDIMKRKPRKAKTDPLVNRRLIFVSMGLNGIIEVCAAFFAYFVVFAENGFLPVDLLYRRKTFDDPDCNNFVDSYGQEWTYTQRKQLHYAVYSVYLLAVVEMQWLNVLLCQTSRSDLFHQPWQNQNLYFGILIETFIFVLVCYCPGVNEVFGLAPLLGRWWLIAFPWGLLLTGVDQLRKYLIRRSNEPNSFGALELCI